MGILKTNKASDMKILPHPRRSRADMGSLTGGLMRLPLRCYVLQHPPRDENPSLVMPARYRTINPLRTFLRSSHSHLRLLRLLPWLDHKIAKGDGAMLKALRQNEEALSPIRSFIYPLACFSELLIQYFLIRTCDIRRSEGTSGAQYSC